jgi:hypothetical protein
MRSGVEWREREAERVLTRIDSLLRELTARRRLAEERAVNQPRSAEPTPDRLAAWLRQRDATLDAAAGRRW